MAVHREMLSSDKKIVSLSLFDKHGQFLSGSKFKAIKKPSLVGIEPCEPYPAEITPEKRHGLFPRDSSSGHTEPFQPQKCFVDGEEEEGVKTRKNNLLRRRSYVDG